MDWALTLWKHGVPWLQWSVVIGVSLAAAACDISVRRIPNLLTGPGLLAGVGWATYAGGWAGLADSAVATVMLSAPYLLLFLLAGGGAGDVKLMACVGAWMGTVNGVAVLLSVSVFAVILAVAMAAAKREVRPVLARVGDFLLGLFLAVRLGGRVAVQPPAATDASQVRTMPYGVAIFLGVCAAAIGVLLWRA